jgi:uncharacterized integral membrane protein (TIGR00698 family)
MNTYEPTEINTNRIFKLNLKARRVIFILVAGLCLFPFITPPLALLVGLLIAQLIEHPYRHINHRATNLLLKISVVGLGFGMNVFSAVKAGRAGFLFTLVSIFSVLLVGYFLGKLFRTDRKTSFLISAGTAICGGSAIAALSPVTNATEKQISVALGTVFILNSVALFLFPTIGHQLHLSQSQFGMWCAIAIHDTSSVVGATAKYGQQALELATTVKLARALWIIPVAFAASLIFKSTKTKIAPPYFIALFILAMLANTYMPNIRPIVPYFVAWAKLALTLTLFLIGSGLSVKVLKSVGIMPLLQGLVLWVMIAATALWAVVCFI